jgi:hypothetical protein
MSSGYQVDWWKALVAAVVVTAAIWASRRLFPTLKAAPFLGAAFGAAVLILASYLSWKLEHR